MFFQQIYDKTLAQASYFIGCQATSEAIVIDAKRDVDTYLEIARQNNMRITHVVETHIHADFLAGTRELAALTGASMYLSDEGGPDWQYAFAHKGLRDGDRLFVGNLSLEVLHTPGHTPESISLLLRDHPSSDAPVMVFTGDFVFVGDVGRPDLLEEVVGVAGSKEEGAAELFRSLQRFSQLPDYVQLWPGHGAGSACGKSLGAVPSSTVGYEKIRNWALQHLDNFGAFKDYLLHDQPEVPTYFSAMKRLNKEERPLLLEVPEYPVLDVTEVMAKPAYTIVDTRHKSKFAEGHVAGALNIQNNNALATWCGWMLSYSDQIVIVAPDEEREDITRKLMRIGMDNIAGFVTNVEGADLVPVKLLQAEEVNNLRSEAVLLDVRSQREYNEGHIPGARHRFVGFLPQMNLEDMRHSPLVVYCQSGDRATVAYSFLESKGFEPIFLYPGSFADWKAKGMFIASSREG